MDPCDGHRTVCSQPPKRPAGRTKFKETRHPLYRGVRRRGPRGHWVCEVRVRGTGGYRLWLGTFTTAEMAARAHDSALLALSGTTACLNFADSAWRMLPVLAPGSSRFNSAREIKDAVAIAVVEFQRQRPVSPPAETADHNKDVPASTGAHAVNEKDVQGSPSPSLSPSLSSSARPVLPPAERADHEKDVQGSPTLSELSTSSDLLDEHWFESMDAGSYYASLAQGMLVEPPAARAWSEDGGESSDTPLWNYLFD